MTSYSDNAYDITNLFCCFENFLAYTLFLPSFIVVRHQMVELNWGASPLPLSIIGVSWTLSKIGLKYICTKTMVTCLAALNITSQPVKVTGRLPLMPAFMLTAFFTSDSFILIVTLIHGFHLILIIKVCFKKSFVT